MLKNNAAYLNWTALLKMAPGRSFRTLPPLWEDNREYYSLLASFATVLPLRKLSTFIEKDEAKFILHRTGGILGEIPALLSRAAELAVMTGRERIDDEILRSTKYSSPAERR